MTQQQVGPPVSTEDHPKPRLRRSTDDRMIAGVCGGLGSYFGVDSVLFRLAFVVLAIGGGSGILLYLVAWLIIPEKREGEPAGEANAVARSQGPVVVGVVLIGLGFMLLVNNLVPWFDRLLWPMLLVAVGVSQLFTGSRHGR